MKTKIGMFCFFLESLFSLELTKENGFGNLNLFTNGQWRFLQKELSKLESPIIIDVGAHYGTWSCYAYAANKSSEFYIFEPVISSYKILQEKTADIENKKCIPLALSNSKQKKKPFYIFGDEIYNSYYNSFYTSELLEKTLGPSQRIHVGVTTLDKFCTQKNIKKIDLLKIDVGGNELKVLKGGRKLLKSGAIKMIEFHYNINYKNSHTKLKDIYKYLERHNYTTYRLTPEGRTHIGSWDDAFECYTTSNYVALKT